MAPSVARESTLHCKLDSQLHWAAVWSIFGPADSGLWKFRLTIWRTALRTNRGSRKPEAQLDEFSLVSSILRGG